MSDAREETALLRRRFDELSQRAFQTGAYCFTDFLNTAEQATLLEMKKQPCTLWGGASGCERRMAVFGDAAQNAPDWPLCCLLIAPRGARFAEPLSHRDYLGALMNLGVQRGVLGDIVVRPEGAYLFCTRKIAPYLSENLTQIKHTAVDCTQTELPEGEMYVRRAERVQVNSPRIDALTARVFKLSREASLELFRAKKVFVDSALCENNSRLLQEGNVVSVRGYGRYIFCGVSGTSKKGKLNVNIEIYES